MPAFAQLYCVIPYYSPCVIKLFRDCVLHAYGCDAVLEERCILIQGRSIDEWEDVDFPEAQGWRHGRLDVRAFRAKIEVLSPTSASTSIVVNINPKILLPRTMVNFVVSIQPVPDSVRTLRSLMMHGLVVLCARCRRLTSPVFP